MSLDTFHPACQRWFQDRFGVPTPVQQQAWPAIGAGRHTLIAAPTGSGKTLAAFFAVIDDLVQRGLNRPLPDRVHILYVSPLKALSNDIHRNLELPLDGIAEQLHLHGLPPVDIRIAVRTGDTPQADRQKMARTPPHILVTTPESLYLLLTSGSGRRMLAGVETVIVDEIHAMLGDKRGAHLALSLERLQALTERPLQRIGLSATQRPVERVARYLVGTPANQPPDCVIVDTGHRRAQDITLEVPGSPLGALMSNEVWEELYARLVQLIEQHDTTLVFVNTRRLSERLALALAKRLGEDRVSSHHGSMSKDHRFAAEQRLKAGNLKVLVATASMELGIDVGAVNLVVQFASPKRIATFLQRVGRSGHFVGGTPKGILFPLTRDDLVECTALLRSVHAGELDVLEMPAGPLDILCQQIVAEVAAPDALAQHPEGHRVEDLHRTLTAAYPYHDVSLAQFTELVDMLAEGYTTRRGRRGAHLHHDRINGRIRARRGAGLLALTNGGAIPDMFDYPVVLDPEGTVVGSLNEDFALEALPGDVFTLGTHAWQMLRVEGLQVRVRDAQGMPPTVPFWFGEGPGRSRELSAAVSDLRQWVADQLQAGNAEGAVAGLMQEAGIPAPAARQLVDYLNAGYRALGVMPTRETLVMERFFDEVGDMHVVIHSPFGSRVNRGWGLALRKKFCRSFNFELQAAANEDSIVISLGAVHSFPLDEVYRYLNTHSLRDVLVQALLDAPMFEVRWRWNATRSLAIQRNRNGKRVPPQFQRMDAEDLVAHVFPDQIACFENIQGERQIPDHPLVRQTIDDCLTEAMDIEALEALIGAIEKGDLTLIAQDLREPSPFALEIINARPYAFLDDAPFEERRTNAIRHRGWLDPADTGGYAELDAQAIAVVRDQAWPTVAHADELHDALLSLGYLTEAEVQTKGYGALLSDLVAHGRATALVTADRRWWVASERLPQLQVLHPSATPDPSVALPPGLQAQVWTVEEAAREVVRGRLEGLGPVTATQLAAESGLRLPQIQAALIALEVEGFVFQGQYTPVPKGTPTETRPIEWCERRLLQRIHRYTIESHRQQIKPVSLQSYVQFLFERHQLRPVPSAAPSALGEPGLEGQTRLQSSLRLLDGLSAPAAAWEADLLPARVADYDPSWLDVMCISGRTVWGRYGTPPPPRDGTARRAGPVKATPITLASRENLDLWQALAALDPSPGSKPPASGREASAVAADLAAHGASFFTDITRRTGLLKSQIEAGLGELVSLGRVTSDGFTGLRALLTPGDRKAGKPGRRRAVFGIEDAGRWSLLPTHAPTDRPVDGPLDESQLERLAWIYLRRWGVVFRRVLEREAHVPPWRPLLKVLRRLELQGLVRGGHFIAGVGGEQFALPETVAALRQRARSPVSEDTLHSLAATDPLNVLSWLLPEQRLPRTLTNRVLYAAGVPVAVLAGGQVTFLRAVDDAQAWRYQQALQRRMVPPRLRSYLGA